MKLTIKLKNTNRQSILFNVYNDINVLILENIKKEDLIIGITVDVSDTTKTITIESIGKCYIKKVFSVKDFTLNDYVNYKYTECKNAAIYKHLKNVKKYNFYYNNIHPYIIEYSQFYKLQDELLQSITDYSKVFTYLKENEQLFDNNQKIQIDNQWFNKAVVYNEQQSSGLLELVQKPTNNMAAKFQYPKYKPTSKQILYTKNDNLYQYNTFWALQKDSQQPLFLTSCESLSIDKVINISNMDYSKKSFKKAPIKAKNLKIRHILDNTSDIHIVSQFLLSNTQISYK